MTPDDTYQLRKEEENDIDAETVEKLRAFDDGIREWIDGAKAAGRSNRQIILICKASIDFVRATTL